MTRYAPRQLLRWRAALAQTAVGLKRSRIAFVGDSITMGSGAGTDPEDSSRHDGCVGAYPLSPPSQLARLLRVAPGHDDALFGDKGCPLENLSGFTQYDHRAVFEGGGWSRFGWSLGGRMFLSQHPDDILRFTPGSPADRCDIYFGAAGHHGAIRVSDSSGPLATIASNIEAVQLGKMTVTRSAASTEPFFIGHESPSDILIAGVDCYDSTRPAVQVINMGVFGQSAAGTVHGNHPWNFNQGLPLLAPDLCIVQLGSNDQSAQIGIPEFKAAIQKIIDLAKLSGDVILSWRHPAAPGEREPEVTPLFRQAHRDLAFENDIPLVDLFDVYGSYEAAKPLYFDHTHQTAAGSHVIARAWLQVIEL